MARRKRTLWLECDCLDDTCGKLRVTQDDDGLTQIDYITSSSAGGRLGRALKVMFAILLGREQALWGIVISRDVQIQRLKDFVNNMSYMNNY